MEKYFCLNISLHSYLYIRRVNEVNLHIIVTENCNLQFFRNFHIGLYFSKSICIFSFILEKDFFILSKENKENVKINMKCAFRQYYKRLL